MLCKKCGKEIADDSLFCPYCGSKVIKEKICNYCGGSNNPDSKFCSRCGKPLDEVPAPKKQKPNPIEHKAKVNRIFSIVSMSLMLFSLVLILGLSFAPFLGDSFYPSSMFTAIGFLKELPSKGFSYLSESNDWTLLLHFIVLSILFAGCIIVSIVFIAISIPKFVIAIKRNSFVDLSNKASLAFVLYLIIASYFSRFVIQQYGIIADSLSGSVITLFIIFPLFFAFNMFVKEFNESNHSRLRIISESIIKMLVYVFALVTIFNLQGDHFHFVATTKNSTISTIFNGGSIGVISFFLGIANETYYAGYNTIVAIASLSLATYVIEIAILFLASFLLTKILSDNPGKKSKKISELVSVCVIFVLSIAVLVIDNAINTMVNTIDNLAKYNWVIKSTYSASATSVVMSVLLIACLIVSISINVSSAKKEKSYER